VILDVCFDVCFYFLITNQGVESKNFERALQAKEIKEGPKLTGSY